MRCNIICFPSLYSPQINAVGCCGWMFAWFCLYTSMSYMYNNEHKNRLLLHRTIFYEVFPFSFFHSTFWCVFRCLWEKCNKNVLFVPQQIVCERAYACVNKNAKNWAANCRTSDKSEAVNATKVHKIMWVRACVNQKYVWRSSKCIM